MKLKKKKKSVRMMGTNTYGRGFKKKGRGKGHRGGRGMSGTGKRAGSLTSFTLSCKDKDNYLEVGKVSTGVKEKDDELTYAELTKLLKPLIIREHEKMIDVKPKIILEIGYEEIQKSSAYTSGYALRFPRVLRLRNDKDLNEINTIKDVEKIYNSQTKIR